MLSTMGCHDSSRGGRGRTPLVLSNWEPRAFERVLALSADPRVRGDAFYGQARALESLGRKREDVLAAARSAALAFRSVEENELATEVDDWISKHSVARRGTP